MVAKYASEIRDMDLQFIKSALNEVRNPVDVAVWGSENGFNFGAILRTGHSFLIRNYYAIDMPWYYERAAMTARRYERDAVQSVSCQEFLDRTADRAIVAFERRDGVDSEDIRWFEYPDNPILLFGSEKDGVPPALLERADGIVTIPMQGLVWDLNIAVACGIALYDWQVKHETKKHHSRSNGTVDGNGIREGY